MGAVRTLDGSRSTHRLTITVGHYILNASLLSLSRDMVILLLWTPAVKEYNYV